MTSKTPKSCLPYEIERLVFLEAASESVYCASNLVQVAKRVQTWVEPLLYRVVVLDTDLIWPPIKAFTSRSGGGLVEIMKKHGRHVRHLLVSGYGQSALFIECLDLCPNIVDLGIWHSNINVEVMRACSKLKLERFSIEGTDDGLSAIDWANNAGSGNEIHATLWQSSLSHLELVGETIELEHWEAAFQSLKGLKYISMQAAEMEDDHEVRDGVLEACKTLKGFAFIAPMYKYFDEPEEDEEEEEDATVWRQGKPWEREANLTKMPTCRLYFSVYSVDDNRLLIAYSHYTEDWLNGALGGNGMWRLAEKKVGDKGED